jgi:hypothetical protein
MSNIHTTSLRAYALNGKGPHLPSYTSASLLTSRTQQGQFTSLISQNPGLQLNLPRRHQNLFCRLNQSPTQLRCRNQNLIRKPSPGRIQTLRRNQALLCNLMLYRCPRGSLRNGH